MNNGGYGYEDSDPHPDERQIKLDTDRSFVLYPLDSSSASRDVLQNDLHALLLSLFRKRPSLHYFQGFHDVISVLFLTLPRPLHLSCVEKMALHRVRDSMGIGLEPVVGLLRILRNLLRLVDPEYAGLLESTSPLPYHALSNLLTLFSHDIPTLPLIQHVWDFLLAREPLAVVWLAAAVILYRKPSIQRLVEQDEEGMIHSLLGALPELVDGEPEFLDTLTYGTTEGVDGDARLPVSDDHEPDGSLCTASVLDDAGDLHQGTDSHQRTSESLARTNDSHSAMSNVRISDDVNNGTCTGMPANTEEVQSPTMGTNLISDYDSIVTACSPLSRGTELTNDSDETNTDGFDVLHQRTKIDPLLEATLENRQSTPQPCSRDEYHVSTELTEAATRPSTPKKIAPQQYSSYRSKHPHRKKPPPISLPYLLRQADALLTSYPPSHSALRVHEIMGKDSVVHTWRAPMIAKTRDTSVDKWVSDDYLQSLVNSQDIVVPTPPPSPIHHPRYSDKKYAPKWFSKGALSMGRVGLRMGLFTPLERRLLLVGALLVVGVALALKYNRLPRSLESWVLFQPPRGLVSSILTMWGRVPWSHHFDLL
ncbi:rab-GTPase-TBC domain-containing protein [Scleroderma citrinum]